jgi:hypothetical protein
MSVRFIKAGLEAVDVVSFALPFMASKNLNVNQVGDD